MYQSDEVFLAIFKVYLHMCACLLLNDQFIDYILCFNFFSVHSRNSLSNTVLQVCASELHGSAAIEVHE